MSCIHSRSWTFAWASSLGLPALRDAWKLGGCRHPGLYRLELSESEAVAEQRGCASGKGKEL